MWIGLFPELSEVGGIQQVSRHTAAVLADAVLERSSECALLGLNDPAGSGVFRVGQNEYTFQGFGRNKIKLLFHLLRALPRIETLYLGHVNLAPLGFFLRLVRPRIQYWVVIHGVEVWHPLPIFRRIALQRAQRVLAVSAFTAECAVKAQELDAERVSVLAPALDPSFLEAQCSDDTVPIPTNSTVLLTVGRLVSTEPGKGVDSVIRVLPKLLETIPDLYYVVVGGGDLLPKLEEMARASSARDHILFIGKLRLEELKHYYARADIFVMPSRQEGFGLVFLEAMVLGKPVIAGDRGGSPEVVQDGVTGFLVDPNDLATLTDRLLQLLRDEGLRKNMGDAGRRRVQQHYSFESFCKRFASILTATQSADLQGRCGELNENPSARR